MSVRRIVAYAGGHDLIASREFYVGVLGMKIAMEAPVLDLQSPDNPTAEVIVGAQEMQEPTPSFGIDLGEPAAVDAASSSRTPAARSSTSSRTSADLAIAPSRRPIAQRSRAAPRRSSG
jgi:hypothetical protein